MMKKIKNHPRTTTEILECCKDIKVLGKKDIKGLLLWHKHIRSDFFKNENEDIKEVVEPKKDLTQEEIEEQEMEQLDKEIAELNEEERKEAKRKKKGKC